MGGGKIWYILGCFQSLSLGALFTFCRQSSCPFDAKFANTRLFLRIKRRYFELASGNQTTNLRRQYKFLVAIGELQVAILCPVRTI